MRHLRGKVASVTGAASGIGRELAILLSAEGCSLALADVDEFGLQETLRMIGDVSARITTYLVDVSDRQGMYEYAEQVCLGHGQIDLVVNNAAVMVFNSIEDISYEDFERVMDVNFWGVVYGTKAFLPYLRQRPEAHIVNMSSVNGMVTTPNNGPYCISRFAVQGLSDTLCQELHGTSIRVSCVIPGGVRTNIVRNTRFIKQANPSMTRDETVEWFDRTTLTSPVKAARIIVKGIKKNKRRILVGPDAYFIDFMRRIMPNLTTRIAGNRIRNLKPKRPQRSP